jgi:hypothetical protein
MIELVKIQLHECVINKIIDYENFDAKKTKTKAEEIKEKESSKS